MRALLLLIACGVIPSAARAADAISIGGAWCIVSTGRSQTAYVYLTLGVRASAGDVLTGATTDVAAKTDILVPEHGDLIPTGALPISSHAPAIFEPFGPHLILRSLTRPLKTREKISLTLTFDKAGQREILVPVVDHAPTADMITVPKGVRLE